MVAQKCYRLSLYKIKSVGNDFKPLRVIESLKKLVHVSYSVSKINNEIEILITLGRFSDSEEALDQKLHEDSIILESALTNENVLFERVNPDEVYDILERPFTNDHVEVGCITGNPGVLEDRNFISDAASTIFHKDFDVTLVFLSTPIAQNLVVSQKRRILGEQTFGKIFTSLDPALVERQQENEKSLEKYEKGEKLGFWWVQFFVVTSGTRRNDELQSIGRYFQQILSRNDQIFFRKLTIDQAKTGLVERRISCPDYSTALTSEDYATYFNVPKSFEKNFYAEFGAPQKAKCVGEITFGNIIQYNQESYPFKLKKELLLKNMLICGTVGSGKTNFGYNLLEQLAKLQIPFIQFDVKKNGREVLQLDESLLVFKVGRDGFSFFNPLIPPMGMEPKIYVELITDIICDAYFLGEGAFSIVMDLLNCCYEAFGIYEGKDIFPTLRHLKEVFINNKSKYRNWREQQWYASVGRALEVATFGETGKVFLNQRANIEKLARSKVIFELDALSKSNRKFFIESLLLHIRHSNLTSLSREKLNLVLIFEEAHNYFKEKRDADETFLETTIRELRELNTASIIIDQIPSKLSRVIIANTHTKICLNLPDYIDRDNIKKSISLTDEQAECLGKLTVGQAIVNLQTEISFPFLINIPKSNIIKGKVTDEMIAESMKTRYSEYGLVQIQSDKLEDLPAPDEFIAFLQELKTRGLNPTSKKDKKEAPKAEELELTDNDKKLLMDIFANPDKKVTEHYDSVNLNPHQGDKSKNQLMDHHLIEENQIKTTKGAPKILTVSEKGKQYLFQESQNSSNRRGGTDHKFWINKISARAIMKNYVTETEKPIGEGKSIDLVITKQSRRYAVEVATGKSNEVANCKKILASSERFDIIFVSCINKEAETKVLDHFAKENFSSPSVKIVLCDTLLEKLADL